MIPRRRTRRPPIASLMRREAAAAVDALPFLLVAFLNRHAPDARARYRWDAALTAVDAGYTIGLTTWLGQTPGQLLFGVRVVDARSGGRPPWTRLAVRWAVAGLPYPLITLFPFWRSTLSPEQAGRPLDRLLSESGDGQRHDELSRLGQQRRVAPFGRLGLVVTKGLGVADFLMALSDSMRRGVGDRAAGTIVVEARRGRPTG